MVLLTDGSETPAAQTPYNLVTTDLIESVTDASTEITSPLVYLLTDNLDLAAASPDFGASVDVDVTTTDEQQLDDYDDPSYTFKYLSLFLGDDASSDIKINILGGSPWRVYASADGTDWVRLSDSSNESINARSYDSATVPNRKFVAIGAQRSPDTYKDYVTINLEQSFIDTWNPPYDSNINSSPGNTRIKLLSRHGHQPRPAVFPIADAVRYFVFYRCIRR